MFRGRAQWSLVQITVASTACACRIFLRDSMKAKDKQDVNSVKAPDQIAKNPTESPLEPASGGPHLLSVCETAMGGVGRYQESLRRLRSHGFRLAILLPDSDAKILPSDSDIQTFHRENRGVRSLYNLLTVFFAERRRLNPDFYFFNSTFTLFVLLALRLSGDKRPAIYCAHSWAIANYNPRSFKGRVVRIVEGNLCGLADLIINVSHGDSRLARTLGYRGHHVVIENAVPDTTATDAPQFLTHMSDSDVHLLFVGRFDRQKGLDILLSAFERARQANSGLRLFLIGEPVRGDRIPDFPEGVSHHGWVSPQDIDLYYQAADLLVVPSRWEGLPLVVPEALRNGTPVWVSDRSDMGELIEKDVTGDVFPLAVEPLADRLRTLRRNDLRSMRGAARASYERRFTLNRFGAEMSALFNQLLQDRAR